MRRLIPLVGLLLLSGCAGDRLETGYNYTPLGATPAQRRGYYADPFSPESRAAQLEQTSDIESRRSIPGQ